MATYRELVGKKIKKVTSDPSDSIDGQMWYNSTTGAIRGLAISEAWTSSANLGTARYSAAAFGSQTAGVVSMGTIYPGTSTNVTEHYDGTGWSSAANYPASGTGGGGAGTQTAGLIAGGQAPRANEAYEYDGTSWSETGDLPVAADNISFCGEGTQTNIIGAIGRTPSTGNSGTNTSVTYNGSVFGSGPNLNTARMYGNQAGSGTGTAGLIWGGFIDPSPNAMTNTEEYDGSSWSNGGNLNVASGFPNGWGTQTNTVTQVQSPNYAGSERYDGTSWTALPDIGVTTPGGLYGAAAGSTGDAGWVTSLSPTINKTVEFTKSTNVITAAAWSSGGAMGTARVLGGSACSSQTSGIVFGGSSPYTANTESYDGTSWTELNNMILGRSYIAGFGTATAAVGAGGYLTSPSPGSPGNMKSEVEEWDGSSWSEQTNLPGARLSAGSCGTQTAGLLFGGATSQPFNPTIQTGTFEYDGSSWTAGGALPEAKAQANSGGIQTAAFFANGRTIPGARTSKTAFYNGTAWSEGADVVTVSPGTGNTGATGTTSAGQATSDANLTNNYDGTAWATAPNYSTARNRSQGGGTQTSNIFAGGYSPSSPHFRTDTEEFTGETDGS